MGLSVQFSLWGLSGHGLWWTWIIISSSLVSRLLLLALEFPGIDRENSCILLFGVPRFFWIELAQCWKQIMVFSAREKKLAMFCMEIMKQA